MGRKSNRTKIEEVLAANGYELVEYYIDNRTTEEDFRMDSWIHKDTGTWLTSDFNLVTNMKLLLTYGIDTELQHGLGFSSKTQEWYGWSHRAISSFGVDSTCAKGQVHYKPANKKDFIEELAANELNSRTHTLAVDWRGDELTVTNTFTGDPEDDSQDKYIGDQTKDHYRFTEDGYYVIIPTVQCSDGTDCVRYKFELENTPDTPYTEVEEAHNCEYIPAESEEYLMPWGKGVWTATTLEEAKQMAEDFRDGVS